MRTDELRRGLRALAEDQPPTDPTAARASVARRHRRHQATRGLVAAACLVVVALVGWSLAGGDAEQGLDVSGTGEPAPGMLVPDLAPIPTDGLLARTVTDAEAGAAPGGVQVRTWVWTTPEGLVAPEAPAASADDDALHQPMVWLGVFTAPSGRPFPSEPFAATTTAGELRAWQQVWPEATAGVVTRGRGEDVASALLAGLPVTGWTEPTPPDGLTALLDDVAVDEPVPGLVVPVTAAHPMHHLRVLSPDGTTLTVVGGDPRLTTMAWATQDVADPAVLGEVHGRPAWALSPGIYVGGDMRTVVWEEGGRGYAVTASGPGRRPPTDDELFAAAEALRPLGAGEWQAIVERSTAAGRSVGTVGSVDTMVATTEGQGTPVDPVTGEPLP